MIPLPAAPLDYTNPHNLEEIRHRYATWLETNAPESFDRRRIAAAKGWGLVSRHQMHRMHPADQADWLAATEYDMVAAARLFHCDRLTTAKLLRRAMNRTHGAFTRDMLPAPTGMVMFSVPVGRAPIVEVFQERVELDVIAIYWDTDPAEHLVRVSTCFDVARWRDDTYQKMIMRGYDPADAVEILDVESSPELSMAMELEIILADTRSPMPWWQTYLQPPGVTGDNDKRANVRGYLSRKTWLPVLHELWDMMTSPDSAAPPATLVRPGKASARRLAAAGAAPVTGQERMVELVYWRKPRPPAAQAAPPPPVVRPPVPTGRTWRLDHEVPVRQTTRKFRDADGNVIKEVPVRAYTRGKGLGPKRKTTVVRDTREEPTP